MSLGLSPSPVPLSGSFDVIEVRTKAALGSQTSATATDASICFIWWFGGQRTFGTTLPVMVGGTVSTTVTWAVQVDSAPPLSVAVNVTAVGPRSKKGGASFVIVTPEQLSVAEAPARNAATAGFVAGVPQLPVHSTVMSLGQVMAGAGLLAVVVSVAVSLEESGSAGVDVMLAVSLTVAPSARLQLSLTVSSKLAVALAGSPSLEQVTLPVEPGAGAVQFHP